MTKKICAVVALYFTLGIVTYSCKLLMYDATICDITFTTLNANNLTDDKDPNRFDDKIGFEIRSVQQRSTCFLPTIQLFNSAYALRKCIDFQNELLKSSYDLSLDRSILLDNETIKANTNLLAIPAILKLTDIEIIKECNFITSTVVLRPELVDRIKFENGEHVVTFKCSTNDSKSFVKTRPVIFEE